MPKNLLLTSFTTWRPDQTSNTSDDLLELICKRQAPNLHYLRKLPVHFRLASERVLSKFDQLQPDILVCCGMVEQRRKLNIEAQAVLEEQTLATDLDLDTLTRGLALTEISHDAGKFVCNTLYFEALRYLQERSGRHHCLFVHVPPLTKQNREQIKSDFLALLERLARD